MPPQYLSIFEQCKCGNTSDLKLPRGVRASVDIDFNNSRFVPDFRLQVHQHGPHHLHELHHGAEKSTNVGVSLLITSVNVMALQLLIQLALE